MRWLVLLVVAAVTGVAMGYRAGAVQHALLGEFNQPPATIIALNLKSYASFFKEASEQGVDILVFPEGGLGWPYALLNNTRAAVVPYAELLPNVTNGVPHIVPCHNSSYQEKSQLATMSCLAQQYGMTVTFDMASYEPCSGAGCPSDGMWLWNTAVALSDEGAVLAVYHKTHLFGEGAIFNRPSTPDVVYFDSPSIGVRFGLIVCFDLEFQYPLETLLSLNVTDFPYATDWVNNPPISSATQDQQGFSTTYGINLIAANAATASYQSGGGIFAAGEPLAVFFQGDGFMNQTLVVADVTSPPKESRVRRRAAVEPLPASTGQLEFNCTIGGSPWVGACAAGNSSNGGRVVLAATSYSSIGEIACIATYEDSKRVRNTGSELGHEFLTLMAYSGRVNFSDTPDSPVGFQFCNLFSCTRTHATPTLVTCDMVYDSSLIAESWKVTAVFSNSTLAVPLMMMNDGEMFSTSAFTFESSVDNQHWSLIGGSEQPLLNAGIWARLT